MDYLNAFLCGGILCAIGQILIDKTPLTPARILTGYVVCGVLLTAIGVYEPIVKWGGAGATVPLLGFGYSLAKGVEKAVQEQGWLGVMTGGLNATAGGIAAAVVLGVGRAIGEAMAVMMVSGNAPNMPGSIFESVRFLTTAVASEMSYSSGLQRQALFSIALVLYLFILLINAALNFFLKRDKEGN